MYELVRVANNTYYMDCPAKVGFYKTSENGVVLIDSGSDKDAAKKVKRILDEQGWTLKAIYNTHSHADHIGGNEYLQKQTGCKVFSKGVERCFVEYPILEPTLLYGGCSLNELRSKFFMAKESNVEELTDEALPDGLEVISLKGHSAEMIGFRTSDDVVFLADSLASKETLDKYQFTYLYDVKQYLATLEFIKTLGAKTFIPSHAAPTEYIKELAQINIDKTIEIANAIEETLSIAKTFEELLTELFNKYNLQMNLSQNVLVGSTVKSYLSYLKEQGRIEYFFENNKMLYHRA